MRHCMLYRVVDVSQSARYPEKKQGVQDSKSDSALLIGVGPVDRENDLIFTG